MELSQRVEIPLLPEQVWQSLNDPEILRQCMPGCETFERGEEPNKFNLVVVAKVGPVKATFKGEVELTDLDPPHAYTLVGSGKGGIAGFAKGSASVVLQAISLDGVPATAMTYQVNAAVGGKLAQIGSRLVSGAAKKIAAEFFANFARIVCEDEELASGVQIETLSQED